MPLKKKARRDVLFNGINHRRDRASEKYAPIRRLPSVKRSTGSTGNPGWGAEKILSLVAEDKDPDEVYEADFQVFPVSNMKGKKKISSEGISREI